MEAQREDVKASSLLSVAEGALIGITVKKKNAFAWAPTNEGRVGMLWQLSYEALDEIASLVEARSEKGIEEDDTEDRKEIQSIKPDGVKGLTCLACGMSFENRISQAQHFATELHKANARRRAQGKVALVEEDFIVSEEKSIEEDGDGDGKKEVDKNNDSQEEEDDDIDEDDDDEDSADDEEETQGMNSGLVRNIKSGTAEVLLNENECVSLSIALLGGCSFRGGRERNALNLVTSAKRLRALAETKRDGRKYWLAVLAVRSGRFAGCILDYSGQPVLHKSFARYTTRRGQGGAQSAADNSGRTIKSVGSMLRRHGERALADEVRELISKTWHDALKQCALICIAAGSSVRGLILGEDLLDPADFRIQRLPFAINKPTVIRVTDAARRLSTIFLHVPTAPNQEEAKMQKSNPSNAKKKSSSSVNADELNIVPLPAYPEPSPLAKRLLDACEQGNETLVRSVLDERNNEDDILNAPDFVGRRPLHLIASAGVAEIVIELLRCGADPTTIDDRQRTPYYLARDKRTRDAFRLARAELGENAFDWTKAAVPEPLDAAKLAAKKQKDTEKKKRQREKQKLNKQRAQLQADAARANAAAKAAAELLALKEATDACDQCKKAMPSRNSRSAASRNLFYHGNYAFCSSTCAAAHRRAQCAKAAEERFLIASTSSSSA